MTKLTIRIGFGFLNQQAFLILLREDWYRMIFPKRERIDRWTNYK